MLIRRTDHMWICPPDPVPEELAHRAVFLAGTCQDNPVSWRLHVATALDRVPVVLVDPCRQDYHPLRATAWERRAIRDAAMLILWAPADGPGPTAAYEVALAVEARKPTVVIGPPDGFALVVLAHARALGIDDRVVQMDTTRGLAEQVRRLIHLER